MYVGFSCYIFIWFLWIWVDLGSHKGARHWPDQRSCFASAGSLDMNIFWRIPYFLQNFTEFFWESFPQALQWSLQHCQGREGHRAPKAPDPWHRKLVIFVDRKDHWTFRASPASCSKISSSARQAAHEFTWFELSMISREIKWCCPEFDPWKTVFFSSRASRAWKASLQREALVIMMSDDIWWCLMYVQMDEKMMNTNKDKC